MNTFVLLFFLHTIVATLLLGWKFVMAKSNNVLKSFGIALLLDAVAFLAWTMGLVQPAMLLNWVTVGAVVFLVSLLFMLHAAVHKLPNKTARTGWMVLGVIAALVIFYIGHYIEPAHAYISAEGLFFFGLGPITQMLYLFALCLTALPAVDLLATQFKNGYSALIRYGFTAEIVGGILLITSKDVNALYIAGWVMGLVYLALWTTLVFSKKAWSHA